MKAHREDREQRYRDDWERMRLLAAIMLQPYSKNTINPKKILKYAWDDEGKTNIHAHAEDNETPLPTPEEAEATFQAMASSLKKD